MALGIVNKKLLEEATPLDVAVLKAAGKALPKSEKIVFFLLYDCTPTWDDLLMLLHTNVQKEYDLSTVQEYARSASQKLQEAAPDSAELKQWRQDFVEFMKSLQK